MDQDDRALRPSQPPEPQAKLHWLLERQTEAMIRFSTSTESLTAEVSKLCGLVATLIGRSGAG
jgi:hypothetical protein